MTKPLGKIWFGRPNEDLVLVQPAEDCVHGQAAVRAVLTLQAFAI